MFDLTYLFRTPMESAATYVVESEQGDLRFTGTVHRTSKNEYVGLVTCYNGKRVRTLKESKPFATQEGAIFWLQAQPQFAQGGMVVA